MATFRLKSNFPIPNQPDYPEIKIGTIVEGKPIELPNLKVKGIQYYYVVAGKNAVAAEIPLTKLLKLSDTNMSSVGNKKFNLEVGLKYGSIAVFSFGVILIISSFFKTKKVKTI